MRDRVVLLVALASIASCANSGGGSGPSGPAGGGAAASGSRPQSRAEIDKIMRDLRPSERVVASADAVLLWQAVSGYMGRAFPLDELPAGAAEGPGGSRQVRTRLVEWVGDGFPHRTRVFAEMRPDPANAANMKLRVAALMIEAEPDLEAATEGRPIPYQWRLVGSNPRIEQTVIDQIVRRYLALAEGRPIPVDEELVVPTQRPLSP